MPALRQQPSGRLTPLSFTLAYLEEANLAVHTKLLFQRAREIASHRTVPDAIS
jgi:hypothetical protein